MKKYIITIDIGNTNQNFSLFNKDNELVYFGKLSELNSKLLRYNIDKRDAQIFVSSVADENLSKMPSQYTLVRQFFKDKLFIDMPVHYTSTLGDDRYINAYHLYKLNDKNKLLIDTGTYTTIDYIDQDGLRGGIILPGLRHIEKTYSYGENLAKYKDFNYSDIKTKLAHNTQEAISYGILHSSFAPIIEYINSYPIQEVYITGGNAQVCANYIQSKIEHLNIILSPQMIHRSLLYVGNLKKEVTL